MSEFPIHTIESAPPASRPPLQSLEREIGFVPNLAATMAESPALIDGFTSVRTILREGAFQPIERETISLAVSVANSCSYCVAAHSKFAKMAGASDADLGALRAGGTPPDPRLAALAAYTRHLLANRGHATDEAKRAFLDAGFTRAQLLEAIAVVAFTTIANYAHNVSRCAIDPQFQS
jgi:uncharacterized peroxidase-related enzyme